MIQLSYDLHLHSCLSPCGDDSMTPSMIAGIAALNGLDLIALTDHNTAKNCPAFLRACEAYGLIGIAGMELTVAEDFHCVLLFDTLEAALAFDSYVDEHRLKLPNRPDIFGHQYVMDEHDHILTELPDLLIPASDISFQDLDALAAHFSAVMFPAHIDKSSTSILSVLGSLPPDSHFLNAELSKNAKCADLEAAHPYLKQCRILRNSDAHHPAYIADQASADCLAVTERSASAVMQMLHSHVMRLD